MTYKNLFTSIEQIVRTSVYFNYNRDWDEDYITRSLLKELRNRLRRFTIDSVEPQISVELDAFKNTGHLEQQHGDIAILIRIVHRDGIQLEGVAFLEAKKRKDGTTTFPAIEWPQIKKIAKRTPAAQVLLYDYEDITTTPIATLERGLPLDHLPILQQYHYYDLVPRTYAATTPAAVVIARKVKDQTMYRFSVPFSYQLIRRYLHGFDLDFSPKSLSAIKGFSDTVRPEPAYLLAVGVIHEGAVGGGISEIDQKTWQALPE